MNLNKIFKAIAAFFRRQVQQEHTFKQDIFDWTFGVVLPVICFVFDPFIFKTGSALVDGFGGSPLAGSFKPFAYILSVTCIIAMMAWLMWSRSLKAVNAPLAGLFVAGALVSLIVGVALFPLSVIGLIFGIGILGFTPLFTALVFFRNSIRAFEVSKSLEIGFLRRASALTAILAIAIPWVVNQNINSFVAQTAVSDFQTIEQNTKILKLVAPITDFESLLRNGSPDTRQQRRIAYIELTGVTPPSYWVNESY